jgi:predicted HTH transcriptional regulator
MLSEITHVATKQGGLAANLNYGTLTISTLDIRKRVLLKDIPDPYNYAALIEDRVQDGPSDQYSLTQQSTDQLLASGEHQFVEFKSSLVWDYHQQRANKALHQPVMKTLVAFLNSSGGYLLIGVDDDRGVLGLEPDLSTLRKPTVDAFETAFNAAFNKMIGVEFREYIDVAFPKVEDKLICVVHVSPSNDPVFLVEKGDEKFYIRTGNASQSLTISQANRYIQRRFVN